MSQPTPPSDGQPYQQPYQQQPYQQQPAQQPYQQPYPASGYSQGYGYAPSRPNNTMALVSLIAGIAGLTLVPFIGSIVAVITGHMAKRQIAETGEEGSGMATGGLVTGYVGIGLAVLGTIAFIAFFSIWGSAISTGY